MSRELNQHSLIAHDLFDREFAGCGATCAPSAAANEELPTEPQLSGLQRPKRPPHISEDLWEEARRRHCDARQSWRSLLDRFVKPHH